MAKLGKFLSLSLLIALLSVVSVIEPAFSQMHSAPSVPTFSVKFVDRSHVDAPIYTTDPYTGETKRVWVGGYVANKTFDFVINHQNFPPYQNENSVTVNLYFEIRYKGQFEEWTDNSYTTRISASDIGDTLRTFTVGKEGEWWTISDSGQVNIQVRAVTGYGGYDLFSSFTQVSASDWSNTQTVTIPATSSSVSPFTPMPTESLPNNGPTSSVSPTLSLTDLTLTLTLAVAIVFGACTVYLLLYIRRLKKSEM
jgi:hypothetical protein